MERRHILTEEGKRELHATRERVEAGDSSVYEMIAQRNLFDSLRGIKGKLIEAEILYKIHNKVFSRRARSPISVEGKFKIPVLVHDMDERDYP